MNFCFCCLGGRNDLFFVSFGSGFGNFVGISSGFFDFFDDIDSDGLMYVMDGEMIEGRVFSESFNVYGFGGNYFDDGSIIRFDEFGVFFNGFISMVVDFL